MYHGIFIIVFLSSGFFELKSDEWMPDDTGFEWFVFSDIGSIWGTDYKSGVQGFDDSEPRVTNGFGLSVVFLGKLNKWILKIIKRLIQRVIIFTSVIFDIFKFISFFHLRLQKLGKNLI